jgi:HEPN domain-containing protein
VYRARTVSRFEHQGDDYPEASKKHLADAVVLSRGGRPDGSAYHAGYAVECALKSVLLHEASWDDRAGAHDRKKLAKEQARLRDEVGHLPGALLDEVTRVYAAASSRSKRYLPALSKQAAIREWRPSLRYQPSGEVAAIQAQTMLKEAQDTYTRTVHEMYLDGVL